MSNGSNLRATDSQLKGRFWRQLCWNLKVTSRVARQICTFTGVQRSGWDWITKSAFFPSTVIFPHPPEEERATGIICLCGSLVCVKATTVLQYIVLFPWVIAPQNLISSIHFFLNYHSTIWRGEGWRPDGSSLASLTQWAISSVSTLHTHDYVAISSVNESHQKSLKKPPSV